MTLKPKKRKATKRAAPLSRQDLLPMAASLAQSISLKNHVALAVFKTGQGNLDLAGDLLKTLYWTFYLTTDCGFSNCSNLSAGCAQTWFL
jgi:hypothetical protein